MTFRPARSRRESRRSACARSSCRARRAARRPQALHRGVGHQRPARARADPHHACRSAPSPRCRSRRTSTRSRPATGGAGRRSSRWCCASKLTGTRPRRRLPDQGHRRPDLRRGQRRLQPTTATSRPSSSSRSGSTPFEDGGWIWFDITTDSQVTLHSAGWYAPVPAPGTGQRRGRHPDVQPARRLRQRAARADVGSVGGRGDRRGDRARPGHHEGCATIPDSPRPPPRSATGCRSTTSPTSAAPADTAG